MGSNCCKGEAGAQVYKGNGTEISIGPRLRKSPVYVEMMREETFQVDETPHFGAPFFLRKLNDYTVLVGTKAKLSVHISNTKDVKVAWFKDDLPAPETDRYVCSSNGQLHSLEIATVLPEDNAKWSCQGENAFGKCVCSGQLTVRVPETYKAPEFVDELRAILTSQGTISLECKVIGYPTPELRWFKDANEIKAGDMFGLTINGGDLASLGVYTCVAKNCVGTSSSSSKVRVQDMHDTTIKDKTIDKISPVFIEELERIKGKIGDRLELRCKINPSAVPQSVRWYNQSGLIEANEKYSMFEDGLGCFLVDINAAELCDAGEWKCVITCKDGLIGITTNVVELDVPRNYRAPRFMEGLKAVMTEEGLVSFECKVIGFPTPILRWYKDGRELKPGDVYHLTGVNSLGSYCCVARNSLGEASSTTFLSVNDIKAQLNEEEWMNLLQVNQAPIFKTGLVSRDVNIAESFRLSVIITSVSRPTVNWYKDDLVVEGSDNYKISSDESTNTYSIDVVVAQLDDQGEWKCVATNEFGQAGTSCFVKLIIPKHYRKPKFLENLKAVMLRDGTVNLECKVIGVPQPVLKWYKDGTELKPGDIHRIITGQDGKCCLGTYTCEAVNCMGSVSSTASLHGYDGIADEGPLPPEGAAALVKDASLSTIHEERTSQMFDTAASYESAASNGRGEISFTFDGKEVSVSLYETPELTNDEALQIVQMFADQLHQNINENENVTNMPALRFVKETSTSGQLVMEALVIDVPVVEDANLFEDDRRTDFDIDEMHDENTFTFESGIASSKVRTHRQSSNDQDEFRSMTSSEHSDLERDVMMSILSRDSLPVLTSPAKTADAATGDDTRQRLLSLVETVVFHLASIREEVRNQSDLAITASFMERSDKILADILYPAQQLHKSLVNTSTLESLLDPLELLARGLSVVEKCVQIGGYSRTFVYRTSVCIVEGCGNQILNCLTDLRILAAQQLDADFVTQQKIYMAILEIQTSIESAQENIQSQRILHQADSVAAMQDVTSIVTNRSIFEDIDFILKSEEPLGLLQVKNLQITVLEFEKSLATILTIVSQSENCNVRSEIARFGLTEVLLELKNKTEVLTVQCTEQRQQKIVAKEMKPAVGELNSLVEMVQANESYAEVISCLNDMFVPLEEMKTALSKLTNELRHVPESEYNSNQALEQQIEEFYELIVHLKEEIQRAGRDFCDSSDVFVRLEECLNRLFCIHTADSIDNEECARMEIVLIQLLMNHLTKIELSLQERTEQDMLSFMATAFLNVHDNLQHFSYMRANSKYEKIRQDILHHARKMVFFLIEKETSLTTLVERRKAIYEMALFSIHIDSKRIRGATEKYACEVFGDQKKYGSFVESLDRLSECATSSLKTQDQSVIAENEVLFDSLLRLAISMRATCEVMEDQTMVTTVDVNKIQHQYACLHAAAESFALYNTNDMARSSEILVEVLSDIVNVRVSEQTKDTQESEFAINTQCESLKTSIADLRDFIHETNSISNVQKPLTELETMVETLFGQPMQMESIEFVNAIASPIAKVTETLKNIDLQAAHVQPTVVLEDCLLEMCESLKQAQAEHTLEQAQENTSHSKLIETVTHVQHDIRECIQLEKDTREKTSQLQQGALESLKQSLSEVQQLVKADIVVKEVSKPLVALEATINELIGQPMQMESIEFVNAIASPIAKVTETLKNIDLQAAHVQPTVVLEDCLLEMCESLKQAQAEHTLEKAQENTSHSKLIETVTHVQHDIRECIQLKKNASTESPGENSSHGEDVVQIKVKIQTDSIPVKDQGSEMGSGPEMKLIEGVQRRAQDDSIQKIGEEATKNTEEEAKMKIADSSEKKVKKESKMKVQEEVKMDAEGVTNRKTEEAKKNAEEEAQEKIEKENKQKTEGEKAAEEAKMLAEEEAKKIVEEEAKKKKVEEEAEEKSQKKAEEAKKQAEEEAKKKSEEEAKKKAEESKKKAEEEAQKKTEEEAKKKADEAKKQAEEEAVKKAEAAKKEAEEEAKKRMEEEAKKMKNVEAEAQKKAEEEAKKKAEEAKKNAEEEAKKKAEVEAKKKIEEESRKKVDVEAQKKAEEETKKKAEEEAKKKAEEEALKKAEEEAKKKEEEEAHKKAEEETKKKAEEEVKKKKAEEEAKKKTEEEAKKRAEEAKKKVEEEAKQKAEEEAKKKAEEAKKMVEEEAKKMGEEEAKKKAEEAKKKREEETKKKAAEEAKNKAEEVKKKAEEEAQKKAEKEAKRKTEEEDKKKAEEEAKKKAEEEAQKQAEEAKKKMEEEAKKKVEEEAKKKAEEEAQKKAREEAKKNAEEEDKKKAKEEAKMKLEEEKKKKKKLEAEAIKKAEEEAKKKAEEAKKRMEEEAKKKAEEEAKKKADEAKKKAEEEAQKKTEEEAKKKAEEAKKKVEEEAQKKAEEEAKKKAEEAKKKREEETKKKAEEEAKKQAEEAKKKADETAQKKAEEEAKKKAEEEDKKKAEEEAKKKTEEEAQKKAEEETKKKVKEEAKKKKAEEEIKKKAEEEAKKKAEEAKKKVEEEAKKKTEEEAKKQAEEAKKRMMEEAKKKAEEEAKKKAEEEANKKAEEEDNKKAEEEANKTFEREAEKKAEEAQKKAEEEAQKKTEEEAKKKAEEAKKKAEEEAVKKAEAAKKEALEEAKKKVEEEAKKKKKAEEEGRKKAEEEAKKKAEEEAKKKDEEETKKQAEEEAKKKKVEEEAKKKKVEAEAKKKAEDEAKKKAEEAEKKAKEEAKKKLEEEAKKKAEEEAKKKAEKAKKNVEEEAKKKAVDEAKKIAEDAKKEGQKQSEEEAKKKVEKEAKKRAAEAEKDNLETNKKVQEEAKLKKKPETEIDTKHQEAEKKKAAMQEKEARNNIEKEKRMLTMQQNASMEKENHEPGEASNNEEELIQRRRMKKEIQKTEATTVVEESSTLSSMQIARRTPSGKTETDHKQFIQLSTLLLNFQELLSEIKRLFLTELPGKNLSGAIRNLKQSLLTAHETGLYQIDVTLVKLLLTPIENLNNTLESIDLYSCQSDCWSVLEECLLQVVEAFGQVQQKSEKLHSMTEWGSVFTVYKSILLILTDIRQCIYQRRTSKVETELTLNKTVVELQLLQKDLEYIKLLSNDRLDLSPKTVDSYFAQTFTTLTLLYPSVVAVVKKPAYSTCVNMLLSLTIPVHDLVKELPFPTSWNVESITPALKHNLRQLYRVVSAISQQQLTRVRNEREVSIVEELKRHLLSLDRVLKSFLDLYNKTEMQKELLETIRRNLSMLKTVMFQVRNQYSIEALTEKDDSLLSAFELVVEKLTINPLQLDSVEYLRLLAESLEKFCDIVRRLGSSVVISDWLLRYQLQLLKIFDTVEFCLSEEQFIVIGSKEKYTRTSTQDAIHTVKQLITHYKITSVSSDQDVRSERRAASSHIKVLAARQGLTEDRAERAPSSGDTAQRMAPDARQHRADTVRRRATRSPQGFRDEPPRSSSRCSLGALPSRRGPSFAVYLKNVFIERDHSFKLLCVVLDSEIDVRWTKDGVDIVQGGRYRVVQKNGLVTLQVDRADYEDTGVYACHVFNNYGQSFNKCTVEVYDTSDDIICPSFSIPQKLEYQQAITSQPISQYTEKPCPTNSTAGAHHYQRSSVLRASSSSSYDHTTVSEYSRRQPEQRESTVRRHVTAEQLRAPRATASRYSASSSYYTSQYGESSGLREATSAAESVRRQRRSYYHERLSAASSDYRGATTRREWTLVELRKSPSAPERVGSATERGEWREWSRKRTSPAVPGDAMDESGGSGKHTVSKTVQVSSSTTDSSSSRTETTTTLRVSEQGAFRKASPRLGTDQPSQTSSQSQSEHTVETDRLSASNRRSQTFPYHYRMDTFATPVRYESLASLEMYQPIVQTVLRDRMVKRGSNLILVCSFWGVNCEVEWVHNYARISNSAKYRVSFHQGMSILEIYDISRQEAGMYKCIVRNDCGEDVTNCCILVLDHIRLTSSTTGRTRPERHSLTRRY
uniref:Ig-like domain-containing protein n=1 Tax=Anopheles atroparvus TaxID=41427 RepID=A0AAG5D040_ANOAO